MTYLYWLVGLIITGVLVSNLINFLKVRKSYLGGMKGGVPTPEHYYALREAVIQQKAGVEYYGGRLTVQIHNKDGMVKAAMTYLRRMDFPDIKVSSPNMKDQGANTGVVTMRVLYQDMVFIINLCDDPLVVLSKDIKWGVRADRLAALHAALYEYQQMPRAKRIVKAAEQEIYDELV